MTKKKKIIFRADGNSSIGLGHVIRSLALVEMLKDDFLCVFATRFLTDYLVKEISNNCSELIHLPETELHFSKFLFHLSGHEVVVLDNYFFDTEYQRSIKAKGCMLVCIDDLHDKHFVADIVINHAPHVSASDYSVESYTQCLLGTKYALLRRTFGEIAKLDKIYRGPRNAFVCFGGSDYNNITQRVITRLLSLNFIENINVVIGDSYAYKESLQIVATEYPDKISLYSNMSAEEMVVLMSANDFAVVPCSSILWECMAAKLPVITGFYVENQKEISDYFADKKVGCVIHDFRKSMFAEKDVLVLSQVNIDNMKEYIDGKSASRLLAEIKILGDV